MAVSSKTEHHFSKLNLLRKSEGQAFKNCFNNTTKSVIGLISDVLKEFMIVIRYCIQS